jgi:hypothetical protein
MAVASSKQLQITRAALLTAGCWAGSRFASLAGSCDCVLIYSPTQLLLLLLL